MACHVNQVNILSEFHVAFSYLKENGFDFIKDFSRIEWSNYFNLEQLGIYNVFVKELWRFVDANKYGKFSNVVLGLPVKVAQ